MFWSSLSRQASINLRSGVNVISSTSRSFAAGQHGKGNRPILYSDEASPPCRAVLLAAESLGLDLEIREVNLLRGATWSEEYRKVNPQHTIPALDDNGFVFWDSHAINCYLSDKYGKNDNLYPKDLQKRALINQRLHFDSGILFALMRSITASLLTKRSKTVDPEKIALLKEAYDFLDKFLEGKKWLAGDNYTLADISCVSTLSTTEVYHPITNHPNIVRWLETCEAEIPGYATLNTPGNEKLRRAIQKVLSQ